MNARSNLVKVRAGLIVVEGVAENIGLVGLGFISLTILLPVIKFGLVGFISLKIIIFNTNYELSQTYLMTLLPVIKLGLVGFISLKQKIKI